ncbi:MAG: methyltransferase domain-containing protein [Candidatus Hatepunaea meridiana]|nr:methyltransferase domain-containing protein [Candidatus Hatepunaea meridiana]
MDDIARFNKERWEELANANVIYSHPALDLDSHSARKMIDPEGVLTDISNKDVLCLASGGGQQSAAFALLGANVTVLDLSDTQLARDREAAIYHNLKIRTEQGDMRDLSRFNDDSFDIVHHEHSLNFIPDTESVFSETARVLRVGGLYRLHFTNPYVHGVWEDWNGQGYSVKRTYTDNAEVLSDDPYWDVKSQTGDIKRVRGPKEYRHILSTVINGIIRNGFVILGLWEKLNGDPDAKPGSWEHFKSIAPPYLTLWAVYKPDTIYEQPNK